LSKEIAPLRLGTRICFEDRWQGRLTGFDVSEEWEVMNISVSTGFLVSQTTVKLPFSVVTRFDKTGVYLNVISFSAFAREHPPIAAPARPISAKTPVGHPGAKVAGALVRTNDRRATDFLLDSRGKVRRVSRDQVTFEGPTLAVGQQLDTLPQYYDDEEIMERIRAAIGDDPVLPIDDKSMLEISVDRGNVALAGNVRARSTRELAQGIVQRTPGVVSVKNEIADDLALETAIGLALARAGHTRTSEVQARSNLGKVTLWGYAPSIRAIDDIVRDVARVPGVRHVESHIELRAPAAASA
jgi:osmotically-inducible protein OsmY